MAMGTCFSSESCNKTNPEFGDDFFFFTLPENWEYNEKRTEFDKTMNANLRSRNENCKKFQKTTRFLEKTFFLCLQKLNERSFDYKEMLDALVKGRKDRFDILEAFSTVWRKNFNFYGESERYLDIRETTDNDDYCYDLKFRTPKKLVEEDEPGENRRDSFHKYVSYEITEETVDPDKVDDNEEKEKPYETKVSNNGIQSPSETNECGEKKRKEKEEEIAFEAILQNISGGEDQRNFDKKNILKSENLDRNIDEMKLKTDEEQRENNKYFDREIEASKEKIRSKEEEYRKAEKEEQKVHDDEIRKLREERKKYEKETERMSQESLVELQTRIHVILKCFELNHKWQMKQEEWENWLKFLRSEVSAMKQQFMKFETVCIQLNTHGITDEEMIKEELFVLHYRTLSSFDILCNAYCEVKSLSEKNPDRGFLQILQSQISKVCQSILSVLYGIDNAKADESLIEIVRSLFSTFDSSDIFYTSKLRDMEKSGNLERFQNVADPKQYNPKSSTTVQDVTDEPTRSSHVEEKSQTSDLEENESFDVQQSDVYGEESENHGKPEHECPKTDLQEPPIGSGEGSKLANSECRKETNEDTSRTLT